MFGGTVWYRRFADIRDVGYAGDDARRSKLSRRDASPTVIRFGSREVDASLSWPGGTSESPAKAMIQGEIDSESSKALRERVLNALELPGQVLDYHFVLQGIADTLWDRRRDEPKQMPFVEWLSWLDVRLVEAHPEAVRISPERDEFVSISAFSRLVDLYECEGFLREALDAAERFERFRPRIDLEELRGRVARLDAERE
ncbi:MAG: hypothetical protein U0414_35980 [Polyangiaceae bacterium]